MSKYLIRLALIFLPLLLMLASCGEPPDPTPTPIVAGWLRYSSEKFGVAFYHPQDWNVEESAEADTLTVRGPGGTLTVRAVVPMLLTTPQNEILAFYAGFFGTKHAGLQPIGAARDVSRANIVGLVQTIANDELVMKLYLFQAPLQTHIIQWDTPTDVDVSNTLDNIVDSFVYPTPTE